MAAAVHNFLNIAELIGRVLYALKPYLLSMAGVYFIYWVFSSLIGLVV